MSIINPLASSNAAGAGNTGSTGTSASQATGGTAAVSHLLSKADQRIQADVDSTKAQLSAFGRLKSAVSGGQIAAQALTALGPGASASTITKTTADFFNAFNATIQTAQSTAAIPGSTQAAQSANRVVRDMKWALSSGGVTGDAMRKLGFKLQADGSLSHDPQTFGAALSKDPAGLRAALASLGKQVSGIASKELAVGGSVATGLASLTQHSGALTAQQQAMLKMEKALAGGVSSANASSVGGASTTGNYAGQGLAAYWANLNG